MVVANSKPEGPEVFFTTYDVSKHTPDFLGNFTGFQTECLGSSAEVPSLTTTMSASSRPTQKVSTQSCLWQSKVKTSVHEHWQIMKKATSHEHWRATMSFYIRIFEDEGLCLNWACIWELVQVLANGPNEFTEHWVLFLNYLAKYNENSSKKSPDFKTNIKYDYV